MNIIIEPDADDRVKSNHEVRFGSSFAGFTSPPSQTVRTPLDVYGSPLIIFAVFSE